MIYCTCWSWGLWFECIYKILRKFWYFIHFAFAGLGNCKINWNTRQTFIMAVPEAWQQLRQISSAAALKEVPGPEFSVLSALGLRQNIKLSTKCSWIKIFMYYTCGSCLCCITCLLGHAVGCLWQKFCQHEALLCSACEMQQQFFGLP